MTYKAEQVALSTCSERVSYQYNLWTPHLQRAPQRHPSTQEMAGGIPSTDYTVCPGETCPLPEATLKHQASADLSGPPTSLSILRNMINCAQVVLR